MLKEKESGAGPLAGREPLIAEVFRLIADYSHVGMWLLDAGGRIVYANAAAPKIWAKAALVDVDGYHQYKAWDYETGKLIGQEDWPAVRARKTGGPVLDHLMKIERFDGETRYVLMSAIPLFDESKNIYSTVIMNHDVTELKASEARREELARIVSHDLKNPLHAVQMALHLLETRLSQMEPSDLREKCAHYASIIGGSVNVSLELVRNILDRGQSSTGTLKLTYVEFTAQDLIHSLRPIYDPLAEQKSIRLAWEVDVPVKMHGDKERLAQVLSNILGNALKFTPPGGHVLVSGSISEGNVLFTVRDTGPGIPKDNLQRIFQKNFQGDQQPPSTGLGLYIAQMMVEAHQGKIWAESEHGQGSVISFIVPLGKPR